MPTFLSGLYYPFSRPIDPASLKQMLLIFESVAFLDPVADESWRAHLLRELEEHEDQRFDGYRQVHESLPVLFEEGAVRRIEPSHVTALKTPITTASALSDLLDPSWAAVASNPGRYRMPHRRLGPDGVPTWQIFLPKMPLAFVESLRSETSIRRHLIAEGGTYDSWTLSYEAGSAISLSVHLAVSEELGYAPVTDSSMHHELLLRKLVRSKQYRSARPRPLTEEIVSQLTHSAAISLVDEILPSRLLSAVPFEDILRFREDTRELRHQAIREIGDRLASLSKVPEVEDLVAASREIQYGLRGELRAYRAEIAATRDKLWPALVTSVTSGVSSGSIAAVAMNFIGGPGYALASSILVGSLALMRGALDLRAERKKVENSQSPVVSYMAQVAGELV